MAISGHAGPFNGNLAERFEEYGADNLQPGPIAAGNVMPT